MPDICICKHCHSFLKGKGNYCPDCDTAAKRKEMDEQNRSIRSDFKCHECDLGEKTFLKGRAFIE